MGNGRFMEISKGTNTEAGGGGVMAGGAGGRRVEYEMHKELLYNKILSLLSQLYRVIPRSCIIVSRYILEMQSCISSA